MWLRFCILFPPLTRALLFFTASSDRLTLVLIADVLVIYFSLCDAHWRSEEVDESSLVEPQKKCSFPPQYPPHLLLPYFTSAEIYTRTQRAQSTDRQSQSTSSSTISLVLTVLSPFLSPFFHPQSPPVSSPSLISPPLISALRFHQFL